MPSAFPLTALARFVIVRLLSHNVSSYQMCFQRVILPILTILYFLLPSLRAEETVIPVDGYAAIVNDRIIMISDVMASISSLRNQWENLYAGNELKQRMNKVYQDSLDTLVARALIMEEFEARGGTLPDRIVSDQMNEAIRDQFNNDRVQLLKELTQMQMTFEDWREKVREQIIVAMLRREEIVDKISVSPLDIRNRYDEKLDQYKQEEQVQLRMISLNKGETEEENRVKMKHAKTLQERIIFGENFSALAREFSEGSKAMRGGDWGWISPTSLRDEISKIAEEIEPGKVSDVISTSNHYYIIVVEARKAAKITPLEEVSEELEEELRREQFEVLFEDWISRLKEKHYVKVFSP